jgi:hypothetical protein
LQLINQNQELLNNLLMIEEAHFNLSEFVNKQDFRYWSATNPIELHEKPLHMATLRNLFPNHVVSIYGDITRPAS